MGEEDVYGKVAVPGGGEVELSMSKSQNEMNKLRRSLKGSKEEYKNIDKDKEDVEMVLYDSAHVKMMKNLVEEQEESLSKQEKRLFGQILKEIIVDEELEEQREQNNETTLFEDRRCVLDLVQHILDNQLTQKCCKEILVRMNTKDCVEMLRHNVFWPLLAKAVMISKIDEQSEDVEDILQVLERVLQEDNCTSVIYAQLISNNYDDIQVEIQSLKVKGLSFALKVSKLIGNSNFLYYILKKTLMSTFDVSSNSLIVSKCMVFLSMNNKDEEKKHDIIEMRIYCTKLMIENKAVIELLALCKNEGIGCKKCRKVTMETMKNEEATKQLKFIWRTGLNKENFERLKEIWS